KLALPDFVSFDIRQRNGIRSAQKLRGILAERLAGCPAVKPFGPLVPIRDCVFWSLGLYKNGVVRQIEQCGFLDDFSGPFLQVGSSLAHPLLEFLLRSTQVS